MAPGSAKPEETIMLRTLSLVQLPAAALGAAALAPTSASPSAPAGTADGMVAGTAALAGSALLCRRPAYYGYGGCYVRQLVPTPWGPRWRLVNRCY